MDLANRISNSIRNVPNFPKEGINFKDITPLLQDAQLSADITVELASYWRAYDLDVVLGIESRGFIWGNTLAQSLGIPFVPVRKKGKLPAETYTFSYDLEYGSAELEIHMDAISSNKRVLIHDDLLATGGTSAAAAELTKMCGGEVTGFSFLVALGFLSGNTALEKYGAHIHSIVTY